MQVSPLQSASRAPRYSTLTLQVLSQLQYLAGWPSAITGMGELQALSWEAQEPCSLPTGRYLCSLCHLALPVLSAAENLATIAAAKQLEDLELSWPGDGPPLRASEPVLAVLRWAACSPTLRRLRLRLRGRSVRADLLSAVAEAQRANPVACICADW